jgi:pantothenate kinase
MLNRKKIKIVDSKVDYTVKYTDKTIKNSFIPLTLEISRLFHENKMRCTIIGISGPPGSGKSSISAVLQRMLVQEGTDPVILPIDGFHFKNEKLKKMTSSVWSGSGKVIDNSMSLYQRKGAKESYDTKQLLSCMKKLKDRKEFYWPVYSRKIHEPVPEGIFISNKKTLYFVEGNYLFLNAHLWGELAAFIDLKIFISSREDLVRKRIIKRKMRGGFSRKEAIEHFRRSDSLNIDEVLHSSAGYDYTLEQKRRFYYVLRKNS